MTSSPKRLLIAASGTGGHLFPAIATASHLDAGPDEVQIEWLGVPDRLETQLVPSQYPLHTITVQGFQKPLSLGTIRTAWRLVTAIFEVRRLLKTQNIDGVLTTGGYIAGPSILAAWSLGLPTILHESNALPGKVTRWLSPWCSRVAIGFDAAASYLPRAQTICVGTPVRPQFYADYLNNTRSANSGSGSGSGSGDTASDTSGKPSGNDAAHAAAKGTAASSATNPKPNPVSDLDPASDTSPSGDVPSPSPTSDREMGPSVSQDSPTSPLPELGIPADAPLIVVVGGSQGAVAVNKVVRQCAPAWFDAGIWIVHLTGSNDVEAQSLSHPQYIVRPFFADMAALLWRANLVISRAGAGTLTELAITRTPSILIPYPYAAEDHQTYNAAIFAAAGAAKVYQQGDLTAEALQKQVLNILNSEERLQRMSAAAGQLAIADSAERLANLVVELLN